MDVEEFEDLVDRLGEDVSLWPSPSRDAATVLLRQSAEARDIQARAKLMRRALAAAPAAKAPSGLADRIVARAIAHSPPQPERHVPPPAAMRAPAFFMQPAVVLSLCFAVGMTVGLLPAQVNGDGSAVDFTTLLGWLID